MLHYYLNGLHCRPTSSCFVVPELAITYYSTGAYQAWGREEAHSAALYPGEAVCVQRSVISGTTGKPKGKTTHLGVEKFGTGRLLILEKGKSVSATC